MNSRLMSLPTSPTGTLLGDWIPVTAREVDDKAIDRKADQLLDREYGRMKKMFALVSAIQDRRYSVPEIKARP